MEGSDLIGKTITSVTEKRLVGNSDFVFLELQFSDGTKARIVPSDSVADECEDDLEDL